MTLPPVPASAVRFEEHPDHAPRVVALWDGGAWRAWCINLERAAAARVADELAAAIRARPPTK